MIKVKTRFTNKIGETEYPIYLIVKDTESKDVPFENRYDLECKYEIYAIAWWDVFTESIKDYENGLIK